MVPKVAVDVDDVVTCDMIVVNGDENNCDEEECDGDDLCVDCVDPELRVELELIAGTDPSKIVNAPRPILREHWAMPRKIECYRLTIGTTKFAI
jgi:hypothetical protein